MLQLLLFEAALSFFPQTVLELCYFPVAMFSLEEAKYDLMCLEAAGSQQGHSELKHLFI